jgi:hypothetical protein
MATLTDLTLALDHLCQLPHSLWPEFQPTRIPVIAWDGAQTVLLQASAAPSEGWTISGEGWTWAGRHPEMVADTSVTLETGLEAAALMLDGLEMTSVELAALVAHECFHVYQSSCASGWPQRWEANELNVFGLPLTAEVLAARRLETLALRQALADPDNWRGHAAEALHWRAERNRALNADQLALERGLERVEGLAHFIELEVTGQPPSLPLPDFAPAAIRLRCYSTGAAFAQLLDRSGAWKDEFMAGRKSLDELLAERLDGVQRNAHDPATISEAALGAQQDASQVVAERQQAEAAFLAQPGPRLVIRSAQPLWPQGFDPQNVTELDGGRALHRRFLKFGNAQASGEILGRAVLTQAAGTHPLMHGFSAITLTNLNDIQHELEGDVLHIRAQGFEFQATGADLQATADGWMVDLP